MGAVHQPKSQHVAERSPEEASNGVLFQLEHCLSNDHAHLLLILINILTKLLLNKRKHILDRRELWRVGWGEDDLCVSVLH